MMGVMIQTAFLVIAILAVQKIFGERLHAYVRYGLWLLVVFRLLVPVNLIDSPYSMLRLAEAAVQYENGAEDMEADDTIVDDIKADDVTADDTAAVLNEENADLTENGSNMTEESLRVEEAGGDTVSEVESLQNSSMESMVDDMQTVGGGRTNEGVAIKVIALAVWLAGSLTVGIFLGISHSRFRRKLRRTRAAYVQNELQDKSAAVCRKQVPIYRVKGLESPCLVGFFRPAIYIGVDVDTDSDTFRYAIAHEKTHYLHRDHIWAFVRAVLVTVYWFHPFVWIAAAASAKDGEIACDYGTVRRIGERERYAYSEMLLTFSCVKKEKRVYSYGTMLRLGGSELKERIVRLTKANDNRVWAGILAAVVMVALAGCAFTGAAEDADIVLTNPASGENADADSSSTENGSDASESGSRGEDAIDNGQGETNTEPRQLESIPADISVETIFGADGPTLDYAGNLGTGQESVIIFHDYFGLIVYDLTNRKMIGSLDLESIGCHMTQGDDACQVAVSADGKTVWLHPGSKSYMYCYDIQHNLLTQEPLVETFNKDLQGYDLFDRYMVVEDTTQKYVGWRSNYLYEEYKDEQGIHTEYIYLYIPEGEEEKIGNLQCVWSDMIFTLFENADEVQESQSVEPEEFPYRYEGVVNQVEIIYDRPCDYSRISDAFGSRINPITQEEKMHEGVDYAAEKGTDIVAAADGVVYATGYSTEYGNYVVLLHINGDMTYYCACQDIAVEKDMQVKRGEKIATVGSSGRSTGAHLHFALSQYGQFVNPEEHMRGVIGLDEAEVER